MKKIFLLIIMIFLVTGCGGDEGKGGNRTIIIGLDDEYAPFGFRDDKGELVGFDIDLAEEVAKRMNVEVEYKGIAWNAKFNELDSGKIDIIWSGFNITPERKEQVIFSKPYMENRQVIIVSAGDGATVVSAADLAGKVVGTQLSSPADYFINREPELKNSFVKFVTYDNYKHVFEALAAGEVDAIVCDELVARYEMSRHAGKFKAVEATVGLPTEVGIGFRKSDTELRDKVQAAFDEIVKDGTASDISVKWFQADLIKWKR